jgi:hypothetical protein
MKAFHLRQVRRRRSIRHRRPRRGRERACEPQHLFFSGPAGASRLRRAGAGLPAARARLRPTAPVVCPAARISVRAALAAVVRTSLGRGAGVATCRMASPPLDATPRRMEPAPVARPQLGLAAEGSGAFRADPPSPCAAPQTRTRKLATLASRSTTSAVVG